MGGGIVWDSTTAEEYAECRVKAALLTAELPRFELLETMLHEAKRGWFLLNGHLKRLRESAEYFDFAIDLDAIRNRLDELTERLAGGNYRVRLLVGRRGEWRTEYRAARRSKPRRAPARSSALDSLALRRMRIVATLRLPGGSNWRRRRSIRTTYSSTTRPRTARCTSPYSPAAATATTWCFGMNEGRSRKRPSRTSSSARTAAWLRRPFLVVSWAASIASIFSRLARSRKACSPLTISAGHPTYLPSTQCGDGCPAYWQTRPNDSRCFDRHRPVKSEPWPGKTSSHRLKTELHIEQRAIGIEDQCLSSCGSRHFDHDKRKVVRQFVLRRVITDGFPQGFYNLRS